MIPDLFSAKRARFFEGWKEERISVTQNFIPSESDLKEIKDSLPADVLNKKQGGRKIIPNKI